MIVGLEVHVELKTETKIFCSCPTIFGAEPNTQCCPVCMGLPGALPTLNRRVVEYAIKAGLATNCRIARQTGLDRKNYFYPDLPKAYQISQYDRPLCYGGWLDIESGGEKKRIGITRIHIEEDAGKLIHDGERGTMIDCNRCGVPLIEIVSEPDIRSAQEAKLYLKKLRSLMLYAGVSDCKMNEGSLRCDVNISVRPVGSSELGERCEIKNLNSFAFAAKAIEYEFERQTALLERGERLTRETRRFDASSGKTYAMRSKESAEDYRYFPEPDLPPLTVSEETVARLANELPRLPDLRAEEYISKYSLSEYDSEIITSDMALADYFEAAVRTSAYPKLLANILISEILGRVEQEDFYCPISPENLAEIADMSGEGLINSSTAKKLIKRLWLSDEPPREVVMREELFQINDREALTEAILAVIRADARVVADYKSGRTVAAKSVVGRVMSATGGRANPALLGELTQEILKSQ
ncbi:MAG: Asp-tRNA(Asn)/Glu-tRNA(Gln) amidotransferase subunit GatB [Clostridia bacterium]|nr:Asp-tRNA(Asn)/Glu-tRNA(Gln) amidotransferase subunit GatB [Clostridia bacterium]